MAIKYFKRYLNLKIWFLKIKLSNYLLTKKAMTAFFFVFFLNKKIFKML